jgi:hypothetical protein
VLLVPKVKPELLELVPIVTLEHNRSPPVSPPVTIALPVNGPMPLLPLPIALLVALLVMLVKPVPPLTGLHNSKLLAPLALTVKLP